MALTIASLDVFFSQYSHIKKYVLAFSGGLDSTVLLYCMYRLRLPIQVVHVNHHLQSECDYWEAHCNQICKLWEIDYCTRHIKVDKDSKGSIEENARKARYEELKHFVNESTCLVTAHHMNDLAETLLLQLLRGAGPAGLAAMGTKQKFSNGSHLRPLLDYTRSELQVFSNEHSLEWVDDPSNELLHYDRNYLRRKVLPIIFDRWPAALQTISRSSALQADAIKCLHELAELDLRDALMGDSKILDIASLQKLSDERLSNALRGWMRKHNMRTPSKRVIQHIINDIVKNRELDTSPFQAWSDGEIRRYRNHIFLMRPLSRHDATQVLNWKLDQSLYIESINKTLKKSDLKPIKKQLSDDVKELKVRFRTGGERLKPFGKKHHRSLKNLFQEANIPPWERDRIPLIYLNDKLIYVFGFWVADA